MIMVLVDYLQMQNVTCNRAALDRVFIATNREDDQDDATAEANDDSSLMRFEFIEIFIRISIAKYIESGEMTDVIVAVRKLMAEHFAPNKGEGELNKIRYLHRVCGVKSCTVFVE